jgi:peptidyl-prolyl cis-trans isomerase D
MATLEKIRSKSVLLFVIIIVALLAFILGDFLTSGRTYFGNGSTIAKAGSAKVDFNTYQNRVSQASEQAQSQNRTVDNDELSQQVISELLFEELLKQEYDELGITVTDKEISEAMTGAVPHRAAQQFIYTLSQQLGLPSASGAAVYDAMMNPTKYGLPVEAGEQLKQLWSAQEQDVESTLKQEKFYRLVGGLFTANELDAKSFYDDNAITRHIAYATKNYSTISDEEAKVTDDDIKAQWEEQKANFRIDQEVREVNYIYVPIEPSQADRLAAQQAVENAIQGLKTQAGTDAVSNDIKFIVNRVNAPKSRITDAKLKSFVDSAAVGQVALLSNVNNKYTIAKVIDITSGIDSINVSFMARADHGTVDSLLARVNSGEAWSKVVDGKNIVGQDSIWTALEGTGISDKVKEALTNATPGQAFAFTDSVQGEAVQSLYRVNRRHNPVAHYDVAVIEYTVDPSNETIAQLSGDLHTYLAANSTAEDFAANASKSGYSMLTTQVSASSPRVANAQDSRSMVKWIMEARNGKVSPVFQDNKQSYLLAVAVKGIYDGEYLPWDCSSINTRLQALALASKKGDKLVAQYSGKAKDIAGYAKLMGCEVGEADVNFTAPMVGTIGINESLLQGQIASAKQGAVVGPVKANNAVVVFQVKKVDTQSRPYEYKEYAARFNQTLGAGRFNPMQLLLGKNKIQNNSLDFVQSTIE